MSVIPANAGVILVDGDNTVKDFGYPRECGGDPERMTAYNDMP